MADYVYSKHTPHAAADYVESHIRDVQGIGGPVLMAKRDTLKIDVPFEDAVRAFLQTPPPPTGTPGSRKVKPKGRMRKATKKR